MKAPTLDVDQAGLPMLPYARSRLLQLEQRRASTGAPFLHDRVFADGTTTIDITASAVSPKIRIRAGLTVVTVAHYRVLSGGVYFTAYQGYSASGSKQWSVSLPTEATLIERRLVRTNGTAALYIELTPTEIAVQRVSAAGLGARYALSLADARLPVGMATLGSGGAPYFASAQTYKLASADLSRVAFVVGATTSMGAQTSFTMAVLDTANTTQPFSVHTISLSPDSDPIGIASLIVGANDDLSVVYAMPSDVRYLDASAVTYPLDLHRLQHSETGYSASTIRVADAPTYPANHVVSGDLRVSSAGDYALTYFMAGDYAGVTPGEVRLVVNGAQRLAVAADWGGSTSVELYSATDRLSVYQVVDGGGAVSFFGITRLGGVPTINYGVDFAGTRTDIQWRRISDDGAVVVADDGLGPFARFPSGDVTLSHVLGDIQFVEAGAASVTTLAVVGADRVWYRTALQRDSVGLPVTYGAAATVGRLPGTTEVDFAGATRTLQLLNWVSALR